MTSPLDIGGGHYSLGQSLELLGHSGAKSNEITPIPLLLERRAITDALVTIDALGCQTKIAQAILDRGGDDLLAVKDNQASLHDEIWRSLDDPAAVLHSRFETTDAEHGRIEVRRHAAMKTQRACWFNDPPFTSLVYPPPEIPRLAVTVVRDDGRTRVLASAPRGRDIAAAVQPVLEDADAD